MFLIRIPKAVITVEVTDEGNIIMRYSNNSLEYVGITTRPAVTIPVPRRPNGEILFLNGDMDIVTKEGKTYEEVLLASFIRGGRDAINKNTQLG